METDATGGEGSSSDREKRSEPGARSPEPGAGDVCDRAIATDVAERDAFLRRLARRLCRRSVPEDAVQFVHVEYLAHVQAGKPIQKIRGLLCSMMKRALRLDWRWRRVNRPDARQVENAAGASKRASYWEGRPPLPPQVIPAVIKNLRGSRSKKVFEQWTKGWSVAEMAAADRRVGRSPEKSKEAVARLLDRLIPRVVQILQQLGITLEDADEAFL